MRYDKELHGILSRRSCLVVMILIVVIVIIRTAYDSFGYYNGFNPNAPNNSFSKNNIKEGDSVTVVGVVNSIALKQINGHNVISAELGNVMLQNMRKIKITGYGEKINVIFDEDPNIKHGQKIMVSGELKYYSRATNWGEFDSYNYYRNKSVLCSINVTNILSKGKKYNYAFYKLWCLRNAISFQIDAIYDSENASILKAMLLGLKNEINPEIKEGFQKSGIAHILAISGLHISFLCMMIFKILKKLNLHIVVCVGVSEVALVLYIIMTGFPPSACRAAIMFSIYLISILTKRSYDLISAMNISLIIITSFNLWSIYDSSIILSYLAIIAIGIYAKQLINNSIYLKRCMKKRDSTRFCGKIYNLLVVNTLKSAVVSIVISIVTLPAILNSYYEITLYSWLLNIMIVSLMPILLVAAILSIFMTTLVNCGKEVFYYITCVILENMKKSSIFLENTGIGRINIGKPTMVQVILYVVLVSCAILFRWKGKQVLRNAIFLAGIMAILVCDNSGLYMLDVGQGDCFVYIDHKKHAIIFDGGSTSRKSIGKNVIIPFLKSQGVNCVDGVFLSHPDEDHMNGILELVQRGKLECINIQHIFVNQNAVKCCEYADFIELAGEENIAVRGISKGDYISNKYVCVECVYPEENLFLDDNNNSLVLSVKLDGFSFLEVGDLEMEGEQLVRYDDIEKIDILKVGHHGSSSSTGDMLLKVVQPKIALISAGKNNRYGHPHQETLDKLNLNKITVVQTNLDGAVRICHGGKGLKIIKYVNN